MKRMILALPRLVCLVGLLGAQEVPKADLFFGYSFLRYNSAQTIPAFTANGAVGTFAWNFSNHFALESELGGYHNGNVNSYHFDTTTFSYLFGPRISLGRSKKVDPYGHVLWGGQYGTSSILSSSILVVNPQASTHLSSDGRYKVSTNTYAMAIGGGLDIKLSRAVVLRPLQVDYYETGFEAPDITLPPGTPSTAGNQHNFRYAAGIAFNFGGE